MGITRDRLGSRVNIDQLLFSPMIAELFSMLNKGKGLKEVTIITVLFINHFGTTRRFNGLEFHGLHARGIGVVKIELPLTVASDLGLLGWA